MATIRYVVTDKRDGTVRVVGKVRLSCGREISHEGSGDNERSAKESVENLMNLSIRGHKQNCNKDHD